MKPLHQILSIIDQGRLAELWVGVVTHVDFQQSLVSSVSTTTDLLLHS
jgi:hypothetical protein